MIVKQHRLNQTAATANWLFAEGGVAWASSGDPKRDQRPLLSFKEPGKAYDDPTVGKDARVGHMRDFIRKGDGFPFTYRKNSGIFNRAFYEAAMQVGTERAGQIWIAALRNVQDTKALDAVKLAKLLESAAGPNKTEIKKALAVVGVQEDGTLSAQDSPASTSKSPSPTLTGSQP
jgi:hypothetical protein